jgi:predicted MFS family arabinose efflux permease
MSIFMVVATAGGSIGLLTGGLVTAAIDWHWIFFINVPIGLISLAIIWRLLPAIRRPDAARNIDYVGAAVFTLAIAPFLIGLTNKGTVGAQWTDPAVGGLILLGLAFGVLFVWIESRVPEPIVPLSLFRIPSFSISVTAMFLAAFGFFGAVIFLPRWFQTVAGATATESGWNILPLLGGLIFSAIASGQIVARTGRYKVLTFSSLILLAVGLYLLTGLTAETDRATMWLWMAMTGLGIGPSFAVFTLIVQNSVMPRVVGIATSSLTFFQQIGGTIGLTIAGTVFASRFVEEIPIQLAAAGVPPQVIEQFGSGQGSDITGTGDLGQRILAAVPEAARPIIEPLIPNIVQGIHEAFSLAVASTFWVGIVGALVGAVVVLFLHEEPMRETFEMEAPASAPEGSPG